MSQVGVELTDNDSGKVSPSEVGEERIESVAIDIQGDDKKSKPKQTNSSPVSESPTDTPPAPPSFFAQLKAAHERISVLPGYNTFLFAKWLPLIILRVVSSLSFLTAAWVIVTQLEGAEEKYKKGEEGMTEFELRNLTGSELDVLAIAGTLLALGQLAPTVLLMQIDQLKEIMQTEQATAVVQKIFDLPHSSMIATPTGEFAQLMGKVFHSFDALLPALYNQVLPVTITCFVTGIALAGFGYGWGLLVTQLVFFVMFSVIAFVQGTQKAKRSKKLMKLIMSEWGKILGVAGNYEQAHYFGNVNTEVQKAKNAFSFLAREMMVIKGGETKDLFYVFFLQIASIGIFMVVLVATRINELTFFEFAALSTHIMMFCGSLNEYRAGVIAVKQAVGEYQVLVEFLKRKSEIQDVPNATDLRDSMEGPVPPSPQISPSIEFRHVSFSYGGKQILKDVCFKVEAGKRLGLVGSSGCGKSTIIRLLLRFYQPTSGSILIGGVDVAGVTATSLRSIFSVVSQDPQLFNGTLRENIAYGKLGATDAEIMEAARKAGLDVIDAGIGNGNAPGVSRGEEANGTNHQNQNQNQNSKALSLHKPCGEMGAKLSGGQQQRVALAKALLKKAPIFLMDEPTTGLDGVIAKQLEDTMEEISRRSTTIWITHYLEDLHNADIIIYLEDGSVAEQGSFPELMEIVGGKFREQVEARRK